MPSVSLMNAGIWYVENAALCIVACDVTEVTWAFLTVAPSSVTVQPSNARCGAKRGEGRGRKGTAALRYCCAITFLEVSKFQQLSHGVITPHCSLLKVVRPEQPNGVSPFHSSVAVLATSLVAQLLPWRSFSNRYIRSLLWPVHPERLPNQLPASPSYHSHPNSSSLLFLPTQSCKVFSFFSSLFFSTIILRFLLFLSHTTVGAVTHGVTGAPTYLALTPFMISFSVLEKVYRSTGSISLFFVTCEKFWRPVS
jgi:hypothetical protein